MKDPKEVIDDNFNLKEFLIALALTPQGLGLLAILAALIIKQLPRENIIQKVLPAERRVRANADGLKFLFPDGDLRYLMQSPKLRGDESWCKARLDAGEMEAFNSYCEFYQSPGTTITTKVPTNFDPVLDVFPFDIPGILPKELGRIYLSDAMIIAGLLGISSPAIGAAVGELTNIVRSKKLPTP